jgi:hypothetical protein
MQCQQLRSVSHSPVPVEMAHRLTVPVLSQGLMRSPHRPPANLTVAPLCRIGRMVLFRHMHRPARVLCGTAVLALAME